MILFLSNFALYKLCDDFQARNNKIMQRENENEMRKDRNECDDK